MERKSIREALSRRYDALIVRKQMGYQREFNQSNFLRVTVPTIPYEAFDSAGERVVPYHLMKLIDSGQLFSYFPFNEKTGSSAQAKDNNLYRSYLIYSEVTIDQSFYNIENPKFPLNLECRFRYAKKTSRSGSVVLRHPKSLKPYAEVELVDVLVDPVTRRPIPVPEWWKTKYGIQSEGERTEHIKPEKYPSVKLLENKHKVSYSDVDINGHANYTFYIRITYDSFGENLYSGRLQNESETYFQNGVQKIQTSFYKECLLGDIVNVESWVDKHSSNVYYFEIMKNDQLCARQTITFHKQSLSPTCSINKL